MPWAHKNGFVEGVRVRFLRAAMVATETMRLLFETGRIPNMTQAQLTPSATTQRDGPIAS